MWETQVGDINLGETITIAPLVVKNVVLTGNSGGELGVRGRLTGMDVKTGKILWRAYSTGSDKDVRIGPDSSHFTQKIRARISASRPGLLVSGSGVAARSGDGSPMIPTEQIYTAREIRAYGIPTCAPDDNKWSITMFARDPETGMRSGPINSFPTTLGLRRNHGEHPCRHAVARASSEAIDPPRAHRLHVCHRP